MLHQSSEGDIVAMTQVLQASGNCLVDCKLCSMLIQVCDNESHDMRLVVGASMYLPSLNHALLSAWYQQANSYHHSSYYSCYDQVNQPDPLSVRPLLLEPQHHYPA